MKKTQKGFTLIELLVVIAIIGILASVVLASLNSARGSARDARRLADMASIRIALELYADDNSGQYPTATSSLVDEGFIPAYPAGPLGDAYDYAPSGTPATSYVLRATLEDTGHSALNSDAPDSTTGTGIDSCADASGHYCLTP